jgi:hypothetical protein
MLPRPTAEPMAASRKPKLLPQELRLFSIETLLSKTFLFQSRNKKNLADPTNSSRRDESVHALWPKTEQTSLLAL